MTTIQDALSGKTIYGKDAFKMLWEVLPQYALAAEHAVKNIDHETQPIYDMGADADVKDVYIELGNVSEYMRDLQYAAGLVADLCDDISKVVEKKYWV